MARPKKYSLENFRKELEALVKKFKKCELFSLHYEMGVYLYERGELNDFLQGYMNALADHVGREIENELKSETKIEPTPIKKKRKKRAKKKNELA